MLFPLLIPALWAEFESHWETSTKWKDQNVQEPGINESVSYLRLNLMACIAKLSQKPSTANLDAA